MKDRVSYTNSRTAQSTIYYFGHFFGQRSTLIIFFSGRRQTVFSCGSFLRNSVSVSASAFLRFCELIHMNKFLGKNSCESFRKDYHYFPADLFSRNFSCKSFPTKFSYDFFLMNHSPHTVPLAPLGIRGGTVPRLNKGLIHEWGHHAYLRSAAGLSGQVKLEPLSPFFVILHSFSHHDSLASVTHPPTCCLQFFSG